MTNQSWTDSPAAESPLSSGGVVIFEPAAALQMVELVDAAIGLDAGGAASALARRPAGCGEPAALDALRHACSILRCI